MQNSFLNYAGYSLNIFHPPHHYQPINDVLYLDSLASRCQTYFIIVLLNEQIDAPRLLERFSILVLSSIRFQVTFYIPTSRSNFAANAPHLRMMCIFNSNILWLFIPRLFIYLYFVVTVISLFIYYLIFI